MVAAGSSSADSEPFRGVHIPVGRASPPRRGARGRGTEPRRSSRDPRWRPPLPARGVCRAGTALSPDFLQSWLFYVLIIANSCRNKTVAAGGGSHGTLYDLIESGDANLISSFSSRFVPLVRRISKPGIPLCPYADDTAGFVFPGSRMLVRRGGRHGHRASRYGSKSVDLGGFMTGYASSVREGRGCVRGVEAIWNDANKNPERRSAS